MPAMPSAIILQSEAGGLAALFLFVLLIVGVALIAWTYQDAKKNSSHPPFLWAVVVFLAPLLGIALYLLLGRDKR